MKQVHALVQSFSKTDDANFVDYVKKSSQMTKGYSLPLYETLKSQKDWDEKDIKTAIHRLEIKSLASVTTRLKERLIHSICEKSAENGHRGKVVLHLTAGKELMKRSQYDLAEKELELGLTKVKELGILTMQFEINSLQTRLYKKTKNKAASLEILHTHRRLACQIKRAAELQWGADLLLLKRRSQGKSFEETETLQITRILETKESKEIESAFEVIHATLSLEGLTHLDLGKPDYKKAYEAYFRLLTHWESHPKIIEDNFSQYKTILNNVIQCGNGAEIYGKLSDVIAKAAQIPPASPEEELEHFNVVEHGSLVFNMGVGNWKDVPQDLIRLAEGYPVYKEQLAKPLRVVIPTNCAIACMVIKDFKGMKRWIEPVFQSNETNGRPDVRAMVPLLLSVAYLETKGEDLAKSRIDNAYRSKKHWDGPPEVCRLVLNAIRRMLNRQEEERKEIARKALQKINGLSTIPELPGLKEVRAWLFAKANRLSVKEALEKL